MTIKTSTGNCSTGDYSTGDFCTEDGEYRLFNKPTAIKRGDVVFPDFFCFEMNSWVEESDMTEEEKKENPLYETTKGYLKVIEYKEAWLKSWEKATNEDKKKMFNLPNFDADIFKEITGIDVNEKNECTINILGNKYRVSEVEAALSKIITQLNDEG